MMLVEGNACFGLVNGEVTKISLLSHEQVQMMDDGVAIGLDRDGIPVGRSEPEPWHAQLFPCSIGNGTEVLEVWSMNDVMRFDEWFSIVRSEKRFDASKLYHPEIMERLEAIMFGYDEEWLIRWLRFSADEKATLWFERRDANLSPCAIPDVETDQLILDFSGFAKMALQVRELPAKGCKPQRKIVYKLKQNADGEREQILGIYVPGFGSSVYRAYPQSQGLSRTVEYYEDGVDLLVANL